MPARPVSAEGARDWTSSPSDQTLNKGKQLNMSEGGSSSSSKVTCERKRRIALIGVGYALDDIGFRRRELLSQC